MAAGTSGAELEYSDFKGISVGRGRAGARGMWLRLFPPALSAILFGLLTTGSPMPAFAGLIDDDPAVLGPLDDPVETVRYANAMADCAGRIYATSQFSCDLVSAELEERHSFWIWQSDAGATVSRTLSGDYRIRTRRCLGGFCSWFSCRVTEWPVLSCSDGDKREAHVPDQSRFVLGGTDYVRGRSLR